MEPEIVAAPVCEETLANDLRPEYCQYRDEGCELSGSCLHCRLPHCVYDLPRGKRRLLKSMRDKKITGLFRQGKTTRELAAMFKVTQRTIQRVVRECRG